MFENMKQVETFFYNRRAFGIQPGLDRIEELLNDLDNPQKKIKAIHIAGTNGKGSTINYLKNALMTNHYKVGVFTSPSMTDITGHLFINDVSIKDEEFISIMNDIYSNIIKMDEKGRHLTEFEIITVIAFVYFHRHTDIALIETGMGGREDATNCVLPLISIITNVDLDHKVYLGNTLEQIASHKAGIIKSNTPVVIGEMQSNAFNIILKVARLKKASIYKLGIDFCYSDVVSKSPGERFIWHSQGVELSVKIKMQGKHQINNSSLALKALELLKEQGFIIDQNRTLTALECTQIPGRFEIIHKNPMIILDGAHNPAGITSFLETISTRFGRVNKQLVFGVFKDKDVDGMIQQCIPYFESVMLTTFKHQRAANLDELSKYSIYQNVHIEDDWEEQLSNILCQSNNNKNIYFYTGSLNFISQVREKIRQKGLL